MFDPKAMSRGILGQYVASIRYQEIRERDIKVDQFSLLSLKIDFYFGHTLLASGTGFLWNVDERIFLVSARHNFTGRHAETDQPLHSQSGLPDRIQVNIFKNSYYTDKYEIELYDNSNSALWLCHPTQARDVDVSAIEILDQSQKNQICEAVNTIDQPKIRPFIGSDVFVVGYPDKVTLGNLPIWKRATIASEPVYFMDHTDHRIVYIDCASRKGMSGSPVFLRSVGQFGDEDRNWVISPGTHTRFFGIYTGRLWKDEKDTADLGIVWPEALIDLICKSDVRDEHEICR